MSVRTHQIRQVDGHNDITKTTRVVEDDQDLAATEEARPTSILARIIIFITGLLLILLAFRFVLVLLGANPGNGFAHFIYTVSRPFVSPFFGLFNYKLNYGTSHLELSTLVAMAVYAVIGYGLARLVTIGNARARY